MKKTQYYELKSNIRATATSFISLVMFVLLGFGIFLGFLWSGDGLRESLNRGYEKGKMHDVEVTLPYAVDPIELEKIKQADDVADAEGCYVCYEQISFNDMRCMARFISLTERIDTPVCYDGELPREKNEIAVESGTAEKLGIHIGDRIQLVRDDASEAKILQRLTEEDFNNLEDEELNQLASEDSCYFYEDVMTVTAVVTSPSYVSTSPLSYGMSPKDQIQLFGVFYLPLSSFREDVVSGYNHFYVCSDSLQGMSTFSEDYQKKVEAFTESLRPILDQLNKDRYRLLHNQADQSCQTLSERIDELQAKVNDARQELDDGQKQLTDQETELDKARSSLEEVEAQLEGQKTDIQAAETALTNAKMQLDEKAGEIRAAEAALSEAEKKLAEIQANVNELTEKVTTARQLFTGTEDEWQNNPEASSLIESQNAAIRMRDDFTAEIEAQKAALNEGKAAYAAAEAEYNINYSTLTNSKNAVSEAEKKIADFQSAEASVAEGKEKLATGRSDLADANAALADAKQTYDDLLNIRDNIKDYDASCVCRSNNAAYFYIDLLSNIIRKLKNSLGGLFLIIGLMICYSVVTRLVNDQKKLIGTKKALGFTTAEILRPYLIYAGSASTIGALLGGGLAFLLIEPTLTGALSQTFTLDMVKDYIYLPDFLLLFGLELLLIGSVTFFGCLLILKRSAVSLLNGSDSIKVQKIHEKNNWFHRLPIFTQTIINNCLHDKRRFLATVIGVSSCVMLLVASITCRNNVLLGEYKQYSNYFLFDQFVCYDTSVSTAEEDIESVLKELDIPYAKAFRTYGYLSGDGFSEKMTAIMVFDDETAFSQMFHIESADAANPYEGSGIWFPESVKKAYRLTDASSIDLRTLEDAEKALKVSGFFRNYVYNLTVFMDSDSYRASFDKAAQPNIFIIRSAGCDPALLTEKLQQTDGFIQLQNYYEASQKDAAIFSMVANVVVGVYSMMSVVMAFFVLLNLFVTFVEEKKRELIVLMINGFSLHQAHRYIYADTIFLTVIGVFVGILGGIFFGRLAIASFESEYVYLIHSVNPTALVIGISATCLLTAIITVLALHRIRKFKLEDINKL